MRGFAVAINRTSTETVSSTWTSREAYLLAMVCLMCGFALGFLFRGSASPGPVAMGAPVPAGSQSADALGPAAAALHSAEALDPIAAPLLAALKVDPKNFETLVQLGNLYYDHYVYPQVIEYYGRALELKPSDLNVRTDLGTAYWYSGFADNAMAEYEKALAIQPGYAPTLMNMGIVRMEGLKDYKGAVAAWGKLLAVNPQHPERERVLALIAQARSQIR